MTRGIVALNGSPVAGSSIDRMLAAIGDGAREAGAAFEAVRCSELRVGPCIACGPDATSGYCVLRDDMDRVYDALERAHAVVVASPIYFDTVSAPLKAVMDRCNCVTPLVTLPDGREDLVPKWARTRRGVFVTAHSSEHDYALAERSVRGFLKWIGGRWEVTLAWGHADNARGSVDAAHLARAHALGRELAGDAPLRPGR